jgi:hypothetical protein
MSDGVSRQVPAPAKGATRWSSFVATPGRGSGPIRGLHEPERPEHRVRVEYNKDTLLVHVSDEDGDGWTTLALDRGTREWAVAQRPVQLDSASSAWHALYATPAPTDES